jgi:hypothetical protein
MTVSTKNNRWYREPWPWLLMLGPFVVVVAAIYTAWLAVSTSDGLVADDYYKRGLAAGQTIARSERAQSLGITAQIRVAEEGLDLRLLSKDTTFSPPQILTVTLSHPTRAGLDQTQKLANNGGTYSGKLRLPASGHWLILIEDDLAGWRLMGNVTLPTTDVITLGVSSTLGPADLRSR